MITEESEAELVLVERAVEYARGMMRPQRFWLRGTRRAHWRMYLQDLERALRDGIPGDTVYDEEWA